MSCFRCLWVVVKRVKEVKYQMFQNKSNIFKSKKEYKFLCHSSFCCCCHLVLFCPTPLNTSTGLSTFGGSLTRRLEVDYTTKPVYELHQLHTDNSCIINNLMIFTVNYQSQRPFSSEPVRFDTFSMLCS